MKPILTFTLLVFLFACSKKPNPEVSTPASLVLHLAQSALTIQQVDSADVMFRRVNSSETRQAKFAKGLTNMAASLQSLTPGTWNADVEVYTKSVAGQSNQYKFIKPVLVTENMTDVEIPGPGTTSGNGWLKRHVKWSTGNEVAVIVPEEVYDSYFEFRTKAQHKFALGIQREAINVNYMVDSKTWACANTCFNAQGQIINIDHFMPFTQTILSEPWTESLISISVVNDRQETILEYDRTWRQ